MKTELKQDDQNSTIQEVKTAMKEAKETRMFQRYLVILLHLQGMTYEKIMSIVPISHVTVGKYVKDYKKQGFEGLIPGKSSGRPHKLTEDQEQSLYQLIVEQTPADVGFPAEMNWNSFLIKEWIKREFGISYTDRGVRKVLHRLGFSYTKPTYTLAKADPEKQEAFKHEFEELKKLELNEIDHIFFEDESMIRDYQALSHTWFLKGQQKKISTYGKHHGVKLLGILDYKTGEVFCVEREKYDAQVFLSFLEEVIARYPKEEKIVIVLDNARIHHAKLIQPFLKEHADQIQLLFLPPYSPNLNLIEGLWGWLKKSVIHNVFYSSVDEIQKAVQTFIDEVNKHPKKIIDRLCTQM